ncbi:MAG: hypothetical protein ACI8TQ_000644 [Planctomycetota bacterium]|jgi:hypothetical protein
MAGVIRRRMIREHAQGARPSSCLPPKVEKLVSLEG